jgi:hypothetical protein
MDDLDETLEKLNVTKAAESILNKQGALVGSEILASWNQHQRMKQG